MTWKRKTYVITAKEDRNWYYVYEVKDNKATKLGKGKTPTELEEKYIIKKG